jgi:hypothetical protein
MCAEFSRLWTTGGAGDGASTVTRADWSKTMKVLAAVMGSEGVAADFLNELAGTVTGANTVSINTGGALVDGIAYLSDAAVSVTVPSAVGAGNTRIDRICVSADWTAQTVRITRVAGTDAASPAAPALTTTSGTLYQIALYKATVNTSGTVTLTDERAFARVGTNELEPDSVDDTIAGNRIPKLTNRQGGSATDWTDTGFTNYVPTTLREQVGAAETGAPTYIPITFPVEFGQKPLVFIQPLSGVANSPFPSEITTMGFKANIGVAFTPFFWRAVGEE